jgi:acyl-CoA reductase-like NAD-dependent aldehyde dehydrogenase
MIGGAQDGTRFAPTLVEAVPRSARLFREEVFGPVTVLEPFDLLDEAIDLANGEEFALQHAVFTSTLDHALVAADGLQAGGVIVNDSRDASALGTARR